MAEAEDWKRFAIDDLETARYLMGMSPRKVKIICYHCQQTAEKYLKAALAAMGIQIPHTHNLMSLAQIVSRTNPAILEAFSSFAVLQPYAVAVRYPFELDISEGDEEKALANAELIASLIEKTLRNQIKQS